MSKIKSESVLRNPNDLKPDPEQPRKKFDQEAINNLANTMKTQGIINPIEIDENDMIITGEIRWKASKIAKIEEIECKQLIGLNDIERFERQTIENIHHNALKDDDLGKAVRKLWNMGNPETGDKRYNSITDIAKKIGLSQSYVRGLIKIPKIIKEIGSKSAQKLKTSTIIEIDQGLKDKEEKQKLAKKAVEENLRRDDVRKIIKETKTLPKDVRDEVLKPKAKITLEEAKEIAKLPQDMRKEVLKPKPKITIEEAKEVVKMPNDVKREVLKPESEITVKEAKEIAEFPKPEQRKAIIKQMKQTKQAGKKIIEQKKEIVQGKRPAPVKKIDLDMKFINAWKNTKLMDIPIKIRKGFLESYSETTRQECYKIVRSVVNYLIKEFSDEVKIIENKFI